jgi:hypothetical protein
MKFTPEDRFILKTDDVVWREVGKELVVLELSTSTYLTLNGTAKHIWESLVTGSRFEALIGALVERYGISEEQAELDAAAFLYVLDERDLLIRTA